VALGKKFFLPVRVLSRLFRGKLLGLLKVTFKDERLGFPGTVSYQVAFNRTIIPAG